MENAKETDMKNVIFWLRKFSGYSIIDLVIFFSALIILLLLSLPNFVNKDLNLIRYLLDIFLLNYRFVAFLCIGLLLVIRKGKKDERLVSAIILSTIFYSIGALMLLFILSF